MRAFFLTTVRWGAFHGDVHAGNMMLLRDGRIGVIDWGLWAGSTLRPTVSSFHCSPPPWATSRPGRW